MELVHLHAMEPFGLPGIRDALEEVLPPGALHHRGRVEVEIAEDWSPAQVWPGGLERRCWSVAFRVVRGGWLTDVAEKRLSREGFGERAPVNPAEVVARKLGGGLVVVFSDAGRLAYTAVYRERKLSWSLLLQDGERLVRAVGARDVQAHQPPPRVFAEGDRLGVLAAGLRQWLREPLDLEEGDARLLLPETLQVVFADRPRHLLCEDGVLLSPPALAAARRLA